MHSIIEPLFSRVWHASWQASVLAALIFLIQRLTRNRLAPAVRYALWMLVIVRLLMPIAPPSVISIFNIIPNLQKNAVTTSATGNTQVDAAPTDPSVFTNPSAVASAPDFSLAPPLHAPKKHWTLPETLALGWLSGTLLLAFRLAIGTIRFLHRLRQAQPVNDPVILETVAACRRTLGIKRRLALLETTAVASPALFGLFHPKLLLPIGLTQRFSTAELRHVFLHELAHIRRWDLPINWLTAVLQVVHWFNPLTWLAFEHMRLERELACDALALAGQEDSERRAYGETILKLLDSHARRTIAVPGAVGILEGKTIKYRIAMIAQLKQKRPWPFPATALLIALAAVSLTDARSQQTKDAPPAGDHPKSANATNPDDSPARQAIMRKLKQIRLNQVLYDGLALVDVLNDLKAQCRRHDPSGPSINFLISPHPLDGYRQPNAITVASMPVHIVPALRDVRMIDVIDAITKATEVPLNYTIEDYAVVFSPRAEEKPHLRTKIFHVDPHTFTQALRRLNQRPGEPNPPEDPNPTEMFRRFLDLSGLHLRAANGELNPGNGRLLFFNDRTGMLFVHATMEEIDAVEQAIEALNTSPPQVMLEIRMIEAGLGFPLSGGERTPQPDTPTDSQTTREPSGAMPQPKFRMMAAAGSRPLGSNADSNAPLVATITGIMTDPQFRALRGALDAREFAAAPRVTTLSGRQARIRMANGTMFDVVPTVQPDGHFIHLNIKCSATTARSDPNTPAQTVERTFNTTAVIRDGQTLVVGHSGAEAEPANADDSAGGKHVLIAITPTIIDPAGNPVHPRPAQP